MFTFSFNFLKQNFSNSSSVAFFPTPPCPKTYAYKRMQSIKLKVKAGISFQKNSVNFERNTVSQYIHLKLIYNLVCKTRVLLYMLKTVKGLYYSKYLFWRFLEPLPVLFTITIGGPKFMLWCSAKKQHLYRWFM